MAEAAQQKKDVEDTSPKALATMVVSMAKEGKSAAEIVAQCASQVGGVITRLTKEHQDFTGKLLETFREAAGQHHDMAVRLDDSNKAHIKTLEAQLKEKDEELVRLRKRIEELEKNAPAPAAAAAKKKPELTPEQREKLKEKPCAFHGAGECTKGEDCSHSHDPEVLKKKSKEQWKAQVDAIRAKTQIAK